MANKSIGLLNIVFGADLRGFDRAMKKAQRSIKKFGKKMEQTGKTLSTSLTLPILALGAVSVKSFDKQQKAIAQVEAGLKSTGNQVGKTSKELQKMASDLQKTTLFGDEEILQGATAQLLTFTNIAGEQFERTQKVALDLATRLDGDLKSASIMLGKALNDPIANLSALSRAGIQFSTEQKEVVKSLVETNRLADAQTIILNELEKQYGGSAEAAREAGLGPIQALQNTLMDLTEDIGRIILPSLMSLAKFIEGLATKFDNLSDKAKVNTVKWLAFAAALGPVTIGISKVILAFGYLLPWINKIGKAIKWLGMTMLTLIKRNPWLLLATGVAALGVAIADAMGAFDKWLGKTDDIKDSGVEAGKSVDDLTKAFADLDKQLEQTPTTPKSTNGINLTPIPSLGPTLMPTDKIIPKLDKVINKTKKALTMQDEYNSAIGQFGHTFANAFSNALTSQEGFFKSFISNLKSAVAQQLAMLAGMQIASTLFGGTILGAGLPTSTGLFKGIGRIFGFANGGLVTGATMALVGEGSGTSISNPEVIAPLDKLKNYMGGDLRVTGRLVGNDIFLSNDKAGVSRNRFV